MFAGVDKSYIRGILVIQLDEERAMYLTTGTWRIYRRGMVIATVGSEWAALKIGEVEQAQYPNDIISFEYDR